MTDERWAIVPGFPGYRVSDLGRVQTRRIKGQSAGLAAEWRDLYQCKGKRGHRYVCFYQSSKAFRRYVHRLVLELFVGPCPTGMQSCHFPDRDPSNNRVDNLRWDTPRANSADSAIHGTRIAGATCHAAKMTAHDIVEIRRLWSEGMKQVAIAARFKISSQSTSAIINRKTWKHLA